MAVESEPAKAARSASYLPDRPNHEKTEFWSSKTKTSCAASWSCSCSIPDSRSRRPSTAEEALPLIDRADLILTDFKLPGMTGLEMLQLIRRMDSHVPVIVMTAFGTVENAVEAMKAGAADFLLKPFSLDHLIAVVSKALEIRNLRDENRQLKEELGRKYQWDNIVGRSPGDAADLRHRHARRAHRARPCCWRAKAASAKI